MELENTGFTEPKVQLIARENRDPTDKKLVLEDIKLESIFRKLFRSKDIPAIPTLGNWHFVLMDLWRRMPPPHHWSTFTLPYPTQVDFTDVITEPDGFHSNEGLYNCAYNTFNCAKGCCYMFLTFLCGGPLAFFFGCYFACLGFQYIWCLVPCTRACLMRISWIGDIFGHCVKAFCDACLVSIGRMFSNIHVKTETV